MSAARSLARSPARSPAEWIERARILVCVGCGGVGKTTLAASLALAAARRGRRVLVLTIDPARRLADALGAGALGPEPQAVPPAMLARLGVPEDGALSAMMLDMKHTFDGLVERFAEDEEARQRILANPIYQHVSDALAGSAEYSAMEKVYELAETGAFDLIVLDTPPSQHALDFLDAPERLLSFLDSPVVRLLIHPAFSAGRFGVRLFQRGAQQVLKLIERVSGVGFLQDISDFLLAFEGMSEGFATRARRVRALLTGDEAGFVLVTGPARESVIQATAFLDRLEQKQLPLAGVIVNRLRTWPSGAPPDRVPARGCEDAAVADLAAALEKAHGPDYPAADAARAALAAANGYAGWVRADADAVAPLRARTRALSSDPPGHEARAARRAAGVFWRCVPELPRDVHDLDTLSRIAEPVFAAEAEGEE